MTQAQLECAVARATGETRETIRQRGFIPVTFPKQRSGRRRRRGHRRHRGSMSAAKQDPQLAPTQEIAD